jgi:signal peptidase I
VSAAGDRRSGDTKRSAPAGANPGSAPRRVTRAGEARRGRAGQKKGRTPMGMVIEIVVIVAAAFAIAMVVQLFLVKPFTIHQVSMEPTLVEGDRILLNRVVYHLRDPKSGDVVVFHSALKDEDLVKRIVAVAGDRVAISDGTLFVNGVAQGEPYLLERHFEGEFAEIVVPSGQVFVLGDNRNNSGDSRFFGPIETRSIIGSAFAVYWPVGHWRGL